MSKKTLYVWAVMVALIIGIGTAWGVSTHTDFTTGNPVYEPTSQNETYVIGNYVDFADLATYATGGVTTADVVQLLDIPAGTYVLQVGVRVVTPTATSSVSSYTMTVGDGTDPNGWLTALLYSGNASGVSTSAEEGIAGVYHTTSGGKYYATADTIDLTMNTIAANSIGQWITWAGSPESFCTDVVLQPFAIAVKPSTQKAYGTNQ